MEILNDIKRAYLKANSAEKLIYFNILFYIITLIFNSFCTNWLALPSSFDEFLNKPWTIVSYAFIHERFVHILSNLIVLYYTGNLFLNFFNGKQFLNVYYLGAIIGGFAFLLTPYMTKTPPEAPLIGASAAVTAVFVAIATKIPRYALRLRFIGSLELWVLAALWVLLSIMQLAGNNYGGAIAHLGGAAFGFLYSNQLAKGNDITKWFEEIINFFINLAKPKEKSNLKTVYKSKKRTKTTDNQKSKQKKIDDILDKISKSGYESLTQEEKDFLFRTGKD